MFLNCKLPEKALTASARQFPEDFLRPPDRVRYGAEGCRYTLAFLILCQRATGKDRGGYQQNALAALIAGLFASERGIICPRKAARYASQAKLLWTSDPPQERTVAAGGVESFSIDAQRGPEM